MLLIKGAGPVQEGIRRLSNTEVTAEGFVHRFIDMGKFGFLQLRTSRAIIQCVMDKHQCVVKNVIGNDPGNDFKEGDCVRVTGEKVAEPRAPGGFEIHVSSVDVLSAADSIPPIDIGKNKIRASLDIMLENRPVALRHPGQRAIFKLQEGIVRAYRQYLYENDFTEIHTPKTTSIGAEGGANIFRLDYFGQRACLAQSPQLYKQMMVGVYGRVFETGPVFRAEKHNTGRHLNEYISLDFEMRFINGMTDIMDTETALLRYIMNFLSEHYGNELDILDVRLPKINEIPVLKFKEAKELMGREYGRKIGGNGDLDPEEEVLLCKYAGEKLNSEFVFISHFPSAKRPFYVMDDPSDPGFAFSFDLLFRGLEITTGGQRIHNYRQQVEKMRAMGLDPSDFTPYLSIHKHGMPPHGGLGLGLERLTMQLAGLNNVRYASLFPRDVKRLVP